MTNATRTATLPDAALSGARPGPCWDLVPLTRESRLEVRRYKHTNFGRSPLEAAEDRARAARYMENVRR